MKRELIFLGIKISAIVFVLVLVFTFVFGIARCSDNMMSPACKDGDIIFFYRLRKNYEENELVIVNKDDKVQIRRIIGRPGDIIEITDAGLIINGYQQQELEIFKQTQPYLDGIKFPLELKNDEYFVLADNREGAKDSRIYGPIKEQEVKGSAMILIRRRGL
ncbi:signal peptidase I [Granulicatella balaenopterae]|uniref:Signal peptidase I n=1 Tax=Granulicatella balaenopterae TaxID=137733 RepID=A0A1H9LRU8_9LACT|nr:signal peptidase I [Granulicatella balaenopterae]SER14156.1 signal peptidase I [Granulicatella balaenopterae]